MQSKESVSYTHLDVYKRQGTEINFLPDGEIFEKTRFKADWLKSRLHETAYLNPNLMIHYENRRSGEEEKVTYHEPDEMCIRDRLNNSTPSIPATTYPPIVPSRNTRLLFMISIVWSWISRISSGSIWVRRSRTASILGIFPCMQFFNRFPILSGAEKTV